MRPASVVPWVRACRLLVLVPALVLGACAAPAPPDASPFYLAPPATGHASVSPGLDIGTHHNRGQPDDGSSQGLPGQGGASPIDGPSGSGAGGIMPGNGSMSLGSGGGG